MLKKTITKIADNIKVIIKNIHIRYEVDFPQADIPQYILGFTLQQIKMNATNSDWEEIYIDRTEKT
jgi:hypothetical protein